MDAGDAGRKAAHPDLGKAGTGKHIGQNFRRGKSPIDSGEVAVAVSIPGDKPSHQRQGIERPSVIDALQGATPDL